MSLDPNTHNIALVVDDSPEALDFVSTALEEIGMTVLTARDGAAAIELVKRVQPDVIMMDAMMPGMDGFEACAQLKTAPHATDAPIIFMTGLDDRESVLKGLSSGGVDYITKPLELDEMIARVTIHVLNSKMMRSAREALDSFGRAVLAVDASGELSWGSPKAFELLGKAGLEQTKQFGPATPILSWLSQTSTQPVSSAAPLDWAGLHFSYIGRSSSGDYLLRLAPMATEKPHDMLTRELNLTDREGEVLYWLSQGKSNRDIAEILTLSARTVNKHLEQVFQKLGVENRTSAAIIADRRLNDLR
jgi:DNA-binding NarL/FixJ family response regulator